MLVKKDTFKVYAHIRTEGAILIRTRHCSVQGCTRLMK